MTAASESAIRTAALRMVYHPGLFSRSKVAVHGLDLDVPRGAIYGFLGHNGAGKTSTIKVLVGLQFAVSGQAWIMGTDVRDSRARRQLGFMPENPYFYEYLNAEEMLEFYARLSGMDRAQRIKRTSELLAQFSLQSARKVPLREFSKGMRQRLGLAQAIIHRPPLVILDEPMSGLDPLGRHDVRNIILSLRDAGQTVFFSSHILSDVEEICDRVCLLNQGRKVAEGSLSALLTNKVLEVKLSVSNISAAGVPEAASLGVRAWHDGALYHVVVDGEDKALRVRAILEKAGGVLRAMEPRRESLEEYFMRVTQSGREAGAAAGDGFLAPQTTVAEAQA